MFINYLRTSLRILFRDKLFTFISFISMAIAFSICVLVYLYISDEYSFDKFHKNSSHIYQVNFKEIDGTGNERGSVATPLGLSTRLKNYIPEIKSSSRFAYRNVTINHNNTNNLELVYYVDEEFLDIFSFSTLKGAEKNVLESPGALAVTEKFAMRYFNTTDVIGENLSFNVAGRDFEYFINSVLENPPENSSLQFEVLLNIENLYKIIPRSIDDNWTWVYPETYVQLVENSRIEDVEKGMVEFYQSLGINLQENPEKVYFSFIALEDIHLNWIYGDSLSPHSRPLYSLIMLLAGIIMAVIAGVNYTSLTVGRSTKRFKEIGVRKILGAKKTQLHLQVLLESTILSVIALPFGLILAEILIPFFNRIIGKNLEIAFSPYFSLTLILLILIFAFAAGLYPSLFMARLNLSKMIGGKLKLQKRRNVINTFVFFQYIIASIMIVSALVINNQIKYISDKNLGLEDDNVIYVFLPEVEYEKIDSFAQSMVTEFSSINGVENVTASSSSFGYPWGDFHYKDISGNSHKFYGNTVDEGYIPTLSLTISMGRNFDELKYGNENNKIIVNEALVREYGWENPIGQSLPGNFADHEIIGVVKDFHFNSLHSAVDPCVLMKDDTFLRGGLESTSYYRNFKSFLLIKLTPGISETTLKLLEDKWMEATGGMPFTIGFIEEIFENAYVTEFATSKLVNFITLMAIIIAATGLFGLITMKINSRSHEISIRKILGASSSQIITNLSSDLMVIVLLANICAVPLGYWLIKNWLNNFHYQFQLQWWLLPLAILVSISIAGLVMVLQSFKVSSTNPADVLRSE